jgi:hypothetical protein
VNKVLGIKITMQQVFDSEAVAVSGKEFVVPKKATILSNNSGTLIEAEEGGLYIIPVGDWFRSSFYGRAFPQVDGFNELQDKGFTAIKDKIVRHEEKKPEVKPELKQAVKENGQEIRRENNVSPKKVDKAVASNSKSEKKN